MTSSCTSALAGLQLLGAFRLFLEDGRTVVLRRNEQRLVALLAIQGDLCRADAAATLWPETDDDRARANLRSAISRVVAKKCALIQQESDVMHLADVSVDYLRLRKWAEDVLDSVGQAAVERPLESLDALLLPAWDEVWLCQPREELQLLVLDALELAAQRLVAFGRLGLASSLIRAATRLDPLRESAARVLIEIHMREGNTSAAIAEYRRIHQTVLDETGSMPNAGLTSLIASLRPPVGGVAGGHPHSVAGTVVAARRQQTGDLTAPCVQRAGDGRSVWPR